MQSASAKRWRIAVSWMDCGQGSRQAMYGAEREYPGNPFVCQGGHPRAWISERPIWKSQASTSISSEAAVAGNRNKIIASIMHPLLDRAYASPLPFVRTLIASWWWKNGQMVGPVASKMNALQASSSSARLLDQGPEENRPVQIFYPFMRQTMSFKGKQTVLNFGMPAMPEQLLWVAQGLIEMQTGQQWREPQPDMIVRIIGATANHATKICAIAEKVIAGSELSQGMVDAMRQRHSTMQLMVQRRTKTPWDDICWPAGYDDLDGTVQRIKVFRKEHMEAEQGQRAAMGKNVGAAEFQLGLVTGGVDYVEPLSKVELEELNRYLRTMQQRTSAFRKLDYSARQYRDPFIFCNPGDVI